MFLIGISIKTDFIVAYGQGICKRFSGGMNCQSARFVLQFETHTNTRHNNLSAIIRKGGFFMWNAVIQLVSGALGGLGAGKVLPKLSLGKIGDVIAGIVGGIGGGQLLNALGVGSAAGGLDIGSILTSVLGGGVGGGVLMAIVSWVKGLVSKK
jgi:uncharacterized membrane protein YeaQ/YmgE (transglycosylase-associated protein family)